MQRGLRGACGPDRPPRGPLRRPVPAGIRERARRGRVRYSVGSAPRCASRRICPQDASGGETDLGAFEERKKEWERGATEGSVLQVTLRRSRGVAVVREEGTVGAIASRSICIPHASRLCGCMPQRVASPPSARFIEGTSIVCGISARCPTRQYPRSSRAPASVVHLPGG